MIAARARRWFSRFIDPDADRRGVSRLIDSVVALEQRLLVERQARSKEMREIEAKMLERVDQMARELRTALERNDHHIESLAAHETDRLTRPLLAHVTRQSVALVALTNEQKALRCRLDEYRVDDHCIPLEANQQTHGSRETSLGPDETSTAFRRPEP